MHLAILMTNTDDSEFAQAHPRDCQKFADLVRLVRPHWATTVFVVRDGVFPDNLTGFGGVIITGSPASVNDPAPWVARLEALIRDSVAQGVPLFGACFGHQAIAKALGGTVGDNPGGWVLGRTVTQVTDRAPWMADLPRDLHLYAAHSEQVTAPPPGVRILTGNDECPVGGFAIGGRVYTTQYHPEMTPDFIAALVAHLDGNLPEDAVTRARTSLTRPADRPAFAESIARFFEQAR